MNGWGGGKSVARKDNKKRGDPVLLRNEKGYTNCEKGHQKLILLGATTEKHR